MTQSAQKTLWTLLAIVALALAAATVYLYSRSQELSAATPLPPYRIAYMSFSETTGIPQLYSVDLRSGEVEPLVVSRAGDVLPVCELGAAPTQAPRIAFVRFTSDPSSAGPSQVGASGGVYVVQSGGGQEQKVSGKVPRVLPVAPAWAPDGEQLAFAGVEDLNGDGQYRGEEAGIYVCDAKGGEVKRVATVQATGLRLQWSPTGAQLMLQVPMEHAPMPVAHVLDLHTGELTKRDLATTVGCWSPDGQYVAAYSIADHKIHLLSRAGNELRAVQTPDGHITDLCWLPAVSADTEDAGRFLLSSVSEQGTGPARLYVSSALLASGGAVTWRPLTDEGVNVSYATPSPDGRWVVFSLVRGEDSELQADLYLLNLERGDAQQLTWDLGYEGYATWVPLRAR